MTLKSDWCFYYRETQLLCSRSLAWVDATCLPCSRGSRKETRTREGKEKLKVTWESLTDSYREREAQVFFIPWPDWTVPVSSTHLALEKGRKVNGDKNHERDGTIVTDSHSAETQLLFLIPWLSEGCLSPPLPRYIIRKGIRAPYSPRHHLRHHHSGLNGPASHLEGHLNRRHHH